MKRIFKVEIVKFHSDDHNWARHEAYVEVGMPTGVYGEVVWIPALLHSEGTNLQPNAGPADPETGLTKADRDFLEDDLHQIAAILKEYGFSDSEVTEALNKKVDRTFEFADGERSCNLVIDCQLCGKIHGGTELIWMRSVCTNCVGAAVKLGPRPLPED
jgi:hypothetical protein